MYVMHSMNVTIIGTGYVGLTTGVALSYLGHKLDFARLGGVAERAQHAIE